MLLDNRIAVVVGGGQTPGETIGNGRATAIELAREGAKVLVVDRRLESARETVAMIEGEGGVARAGFVDVSGRAVDRAHDRGLSRRVGAHRHPAQQRRRQPAGGDAPVEDITDEVFDRVTSINLRGMVLACKHALPIMRAQRSGVIINISSMAAWGSYPYVAYKTSKAGVIALHRTLAIAQRAIRHPRERDPAGADEHADGDRRSRRRPDGNRATK